MLSKMILFSICLLPPTAGAITRRTLLQNAGAFLAKSALPLRTVRAAQGLKTEILPVLSSTTVYERLLQYFPSQSARVEGSEKISAILWTEWESRQKDNGRTDTFVDHYWKRIDQAFNLAGSDPSAWADHKPQIYAHLEQVEADLAREFATTKESVKTTINLLLNHGELFGDQPPPDFAMLPLNDAFEKSLLQRLERIQPDLALLALSRFTQDLENTAYVALGIRGHSIQFIGWANRYPKLKTAKVLEFQFTKFLLGPDLVSALPEAAELAWPRFEPLYLNAIARADRTLERLRDFPASAFRRRVFELISGLRQGLLAEVLDFENRYQEMRSVFSEEPVSRRLPVKGALKISLESAPPVRPENTSSGTESPLPAPCAQALSHDEPPWLPAPAEPESAERREVRQFVVDAGPGDLVHADPQPIVRGD